MFNKNIRFNLSVFFVILLISVNVHFVKACEPYPQVWFLGDVTWNKNSLPEGIEFTTFRNLGGLEIVNTTAHHAWIFNKSYYDALIEAERMDSSNSVDTSLDEMVQTLVFQEYKGMDIAPNKSDDVSDRIAGSEILYLKRHMQPPPPKVKIPDERTFEFLLVHQQGIYPVEVVMSYSLNTEFEFTDCGYMIDEPTFLSSTKSRIMFLILIVGAVSSFLWFSEELLEKYRDMRS